MKTIYSICLLCISAFMFVGCSTVKKVVTQEKSVSHTMVSDGIRLEKVDLVISTYDAGNEPTVSVNTVFSEYQHRVDRMKTWNRDTESGWRYRSDTFNSKKFKADPLLLICFAPIMIPLEIITAPFTYALGYNRVRVTKSGPEYNVKYYMKNGPRERKQTGFNNTLPEAVLFSIVDFNRTVRMPYANGHYKFPVSSTPKLLKLDRLNLKFPGDDELKRLPLAAYHRAYQDYTNLKNAKNQALLAERNRQQRIRLENDRKKKAITQHKQALSRQLSKVSDAVGGKNWKAAVNHQKELIALMQRGAYSAPSKADLSSAYEKLVEYASETGDFDEISAAMKLHKAASGK